MTKEVSNKYEGKAKKFIVILTVLANFGLGMGFALGNYIFMRTPPSFQLNP